MERLWPAFSLLENVPVLVFMAPIALELTASWKHHYSAGELAWLWPLGSKMASNYRQYQAILRIKIL
jgi:hypothetical protein